MTWFANHQFFYQYYNLFQISALKFCFLNCAILKDFDNVSFINNMYDAYKYMMLYLSEFPCHCGD